jgi:oligopeptide transport system ATP-binding protein
MMALLELDNLTVSFATPSGRVPAVRGIDLRIGEGECVAIVGESGSGKSQTMLACAGLLAANGSTSGSVRFAGEDILGLPEARLERLRGPGFGYVFQDALGSLTPHLRVGDQLAESLLAHRDVGRSAALAEARRMLERVQVPDVSSRMTQYPHELSGGTRQRVAIAAALMPRPRLLIADEPTTALDVTVQAQVVALFSELRRELGMALVLVTHDLGVVAGLAERVVVLYAGAIVEEAATPRLFESPAHPYTAGLLEALPRLDDPADAPMRSIPGFPPRPDQLPPGCAFAGRCTRRVERCQRQVPALLTDVGSRVACHRPLRREQQA